MSTANLRLSDHSERLLANFHAWRSNRLHRTLFPFLLALAIFLVAWAAGVI